MTSVSREEVDGSVDPAFYAPLLGTEPSAHEMDVLNRRVIDRASDGCRPTVGPNHLVMINLRWFTARIESVLHSLARVVDRDGRGHHLMFDDATEQWVEYSRPNGLVIGVYDGLRSPDAHERAPAE